MNTKLFQNQLDGRSVLIVGGTSVSACQPQSRPRLQERR
jgi:hypothetical protein